MHKIYLSESTYLYSGNILTFSGVVDKLSVTYMKFLRDSVYQKSFRSLDF